MRTNCTKYRWHGAAPCAKELAASVPSALGSAASTRTSPDPTPAGSTCSVRAKSPQHAVQKQNSCTTGLHGSSMRRLGDPLVLESLQWGLQQSPAAAESITLQPAWLPQSSAVCTCCNNLRVVMQPQPTSCSRLPLPAATAYSPWRGCSHPAAMVFACARSRCTGCTG